MLRSLHKKILGLDGETQHVMRTVAAACEVSGQRVLDVGCGYGRLLALLQAAGLDATGVEINPEIVAANRKVGLHCITLDEFSRSTNQYDVLLMAHVIEHFGPADLLRFMDGYLDRLKPGGHLVIATPLMSDYFYDDFDHIRPYQPAGILMVFGEDAPQVQYYSRNKLALSELWFRRSPKRISYAQGRYLPTRGRWALFALDLIAGAAFVLSGRHFGTINGWVGVFRKTRG